MKLSKKIGYCNKNIASQKLNLAANTQKSCISSKSSNDNFLYVPLTNRVGQEVKLPIKPGYICLAGNKEQRISLLRYFVDTAISANICLWELDARRFGADAKIISIPGAYFVIHIDLETISYALFKQINQYCHTKLIFQLPGHHMLCGLAARHSCTLGNEELIRSLGGNSAQDIRDRSHLIASLSEDEFLAISAQREVICKVAM